MIDVEKRKMKKNNSKTLRLILGDQLNYNHSWFETVDDSITYVMMEIRTETDYATHHVQKIVGFYAAMRQFANELLVKKHHVIYLKLTDNTNLQSFEKNIEKLATQTKTKTKHVRCDQDALKHPVYVG